MRKWILFVALMMVTSAGSARAQAWDSRGWVLLGEREVNGKLDHDRIEVGAMEGTFSKVTMVVQNSDLELVDFKITFADKTNYHPKLTYFFKEGARTRVIDLPPAEPFIRAIDFSYRNVPGGGRAKVQVWGWRTNGGVVPPQPMPPTPVPPTPAPAWDSRGWTMLGERTVNGNRDRDRITVGRYQGKFTKLTLVVLDSDLELNDMAVKFARGPEWHPDVKQVFREGQRTRAIDLPGDERVIKFIDFRYRNLPGTGRARVQVWAKADASPAPMPPQPAWDNRGWQLLGERVVDGHGKEDTDHIEVGRAEGKFQKLMLVVTDSDLEIIDFLVKFKKGEPYHPEVKAFFREGTRTRPIDLPGNQDRIIKWLEFRYRNLPGGGKAKVQVWAK